MVSPYLLSNHVFLSVVGEHCVFLDLKKDKYLSLNRAKTKAFGRHIAGWPSDCENDDVSRASPITSSYDSNISALANRGLLTLDPCNGKQASTVSVAVPTTALNRRDLDVTISVSTSHIVAFMVGSVRAAAMLRWRSIESIANRVERRKKSNGSSNDPLEFAETERLLAIFDTLRPFFPAEYLCLFDSLLLVEFLAQKGIYPTWVFGVRTKPWGAHCWVQQSDVVLNDYLERVRNYTPIMAI